MKTKRKLIFWAITIALTLGLIDLFSFLAGYFLLSRYGNGNKLKLYHARFLPEFKAGKDAYIKYLNKRDNVLGWPTKPYLARENLFDDIGSRISTYFPDPFAQKACISLYGDSFTFSLEVDNEHAWGNILANLQKCRVNNFAIPGYGTDQAFLRYKNNPHEKSSIVILGILSENVNRNVNQFRRFYVPQDVVLFGFKPRFIEDGNKLKLIPIPQIPPDKYPDFLYHPEKYLKHENFSPCQSGAYTCFKFPFTVSLLEAVFREAKKRLSDEVLSHQGKKISEQNIFSPSHSSRAIHITTSIAKEFVDLAILKGQKPLILLIPTNQDLKNYKRNNKWSYQSLINTLEDLENTVVLNSGEVFIDYLKGRNPNILYIKKKTGGGHFNEEGYRVLAEYVNKELGDVLPSDTP